MRLVTAADLDRVFKAYDVRGVVPDDLDEDLVRKIGAAFASRTARGATRAPMATPSRTTTKSVVKTCQPVRRISVSSEP